MNINLFIPFLSRLSTTLILKITTLKNFKIVFQYTSILLFEILFPF